MSRDELYEWRAQAQRLREIIAEPGFRTAYEVLGSILDIVGPDVVLAAIRVWDWERRTQNGKYPDEWEKQWKLQ